MTVRISRGKGKILDTGPRPFEADIDYRLHEEMDVRGALQGWWGEFTFEESITLEDGEDFTMVLDDKRKGTCSIARRINKAVRLVPPRYFYFFRGAGELK